MGFLGVLALAVLGQLEIHPQVAALRSGEAGLTSVEIRGVAPDLTSVELTASAGMVVPPMRTGPGKYRATFRPPPNGAAPYILLHATASSDRRSESAWLAWPVQGATGTGPWRIGLAALSRRPAASWAEPLTVELFAIGKDGAPVPRSHPIALASDRGTLGLLAPQGNGIFRGSVRGPERAEGQISVTAVLLDDPTQARTLAIGALPGPPERAEISLLPPEPRAGGDPAQFLVDVRDRFGNLVPGAALAARPSRGKLEELREVSAGKYRVKVSVPANEEPGTIDLDVQVAGESAKIESHRPVRLLPPQAPWGISAGAALTGHSNFGFVSGAGARAEAALRIAKTAFETFVDLGGRWDLPASSIPYPPAQDASVHLALDAMAFEGSAGVRLSLLDVGSRASLFASAAAGAQYLTGDLRIVGGPASGTRQAIGVLSPAFSGAVGGTYALRGGRVFIEARYTAALGGGALRGNLAGLSIGAGYLFDLGGSR